MSVTHKQYPRYRKMGERFDILGENNKRRATNFKVGGMRGGYDSMYNTQFMKDPNEKISRTIITDEMKNELGKSSWDYSRSWRKNFKSETMQTYMSRQDLDSFRKNKKYTEGNTMN
jgi:predicted HNH restriction endonuclease